MGDNFVRSEAVATCPAWGQSAHCWPHRDHGCSGKPELCYARDDDCLFRCLPAGGTTGRHEAPMESDGN